jgi:outer membrane protein OmpA-like peptidoglycan-associated protein
MARFFTSCRAPILGLGALLGATALAGPALIRHSIHTDLSRSATSWLAAEGLSDVVVEKVDGQDIVLRGPAKQMNAATELMFRNRSNAHWIDGITYNPTANPTTTTVAAPASTAAAVQTTASPATTTTAVATTVPATTVPVLTTVPTSAAAAEPICPALPPLTGVAFETSSARLTAAAQTVLNAVADTLKASPGCTIRIGGHTDSRGDANANQELSFNRAQAVRQYLIDKGIKPENLTAVGFGEGNLKISPETNDEDRAANRRIEFSPTNTGS